VRGFEDVVSVREENTFSNVMKRLLNNYETSNEAGVKVEYRIPEPAL
jgi:transcriptional regulator